MENSEKPIYPHLNSDGIATSTMNIGSGGVNGLTKREYFAGLAMQGLLSNEYITKIMEGDKYNPTADTAKMAILFADELLNQLNDNK